MENQIPPSQVPSQPQLTAEQIEEMKARARQMALQQTLMQAQPPQQPNVVYVRRNLTIAELIIVLLLSVGIVTGIQWTWNFATNLLPRIEIKVR